MANTKKMTTSPQSRRRRKPAKPVGARALLLTLALGGTLGGWAGLAISAMHVEEITNAPTTPLPDPALETQVILLSASPEAQALELPPIPTVQPPPAAINTDAISTVQTAPAVTLAPIPAVPQPVVQRPVARSRSSR